MEYPTALLRAMVFSKSESLRFPSPIPSKLPSCSLIFTSHQYSDPCGMDTSVSYCKQNTNDLFFASSYSFFFSLYTSSAALNISLSALDSEDLFFGAVGRGGIGFCTKSYQ